MQAKDYYGILGVASGATADEIKKAYRKIAKKNHPDRNPGDTQAEDRFKEASEAYSILGDEDKRKRYDALKQYGFGSGGFPGGGGGPRGGGPGGFPGGVRFTQGPGGKQYVHFDGDMGDMDFSDLFGEQSPFSDAFASLFGQRVGTGRGGGFGGQAQPRRPRRPAQENLGTDDFFKRQGLDVYCTVWLKVDQLEGGAKVKVRTPSGKKALVKIPPGTKIGQRFRLKGLGLSQNGHRGDQYVEVKAVA